MIFHLGTEGSNGPYLEIGVSHVFFCLGTEGSKGSLLRNGWFQWFSV